MRKIFPALFAVCALVAALCACQTTVDNDEMMQRMQQNQRAATMRAA